MKHEDEPPRRTRLDDFLDWLGRLLFAFMVISLIAFFFTVWAGESGWTLTV